MYTKPMLEKFGTFRELTTAGFGDDGDAFIWGPDPSIDVDGCEFDPFGGCRS